MKQARVELSRDQSIVAVFLVALLTRGFLWLRTAPGPLVGDALEYREYARHLYESGRYMGPEGAFATRMPGYPLFLAAVHFIGGDSPAALIAAQCILGAITCVLLWDLARRLLGDEWGLLCGLAAGAYADLMTAAVAPLSESLYSFFLVLSVWALYHEDWKPRVRAAAYGLLSGCLYLVRPEPLPYIVCTCLLMPYLWAKFTRKEVLTGLAGFALVMGVWVGRNFAQLGTPVPASTVGKNVGYLSLYLPAYKLGLAGERYSAPEGLDELSRDAAFAVEWKRLAATLTWPQIVKCYAYNLASILYPFLPAYDWTYAFLFPFFLAGSWLAARRKELWPLAGAVLCSLTVFTFFGGYASRYRQGISPFIVLLAMAGLQAARDRFGSARLRRAAGAWLALNIGILILQPQARELALRLRGAAWGH